MDKIRKIAQEAIKGVDNIYTQVCCLVVDAFIFVFTCCSQHKPLLYHIVNDLLQVREFVLRGWWVV